MLFIKVIKLFVSFLTWGTNDKVKNITKMMMCNNTSPMESDNFFLYHDDVQFLMQDQLPMFHLDCVCNLTSDDKFSIHIKRHFAYPLTNNTNETSFSRFHIDFKYTNTTIDLLQEVNPFGNDCLFGQEEECYFHDVYKERTINFSFKEFGSFSRFILNVKGKEVIKISCINTIKVEKEDDEPPLISTDIATNTKTLTKTKDSKEHILFNIGITLTCLGVILLILIPVLAIVYKFNPTFRKVTSQILQQKPKIVSVETPTTTSNNPGVNEITLQVPTAIDEEYYEAVSTGEPEIYNDKYEFCEIEDNKTQKATEKAGGEVAPQLPSTPLPNKQINPPLLTKPLQQNNIEREDVDINRHSHLPTDNLAVHLRTSNWYQSKEKESAIVELDDNYDHFPDTQCQTSIGDQSKKKDSAIAELDDNYDHFPVNQCRTSNGDQSKKKDSAIIELEDNYDHFPGYISKEKDSSNKPKDTGIFVLPIDETENRGQEVAKVPTQHPEASTNEEYQPTNKIRTLQNRDLYRISSASTNSDVWISNNLTETKSINALNEKRSTCKDIPNYGRSNSEGNSLQTNQTASFAVVMAEFKTYVESKPTPQTQNEWIYLENDLYQSLDSDIGT